MALEYSLEICTDKTSADLLQFVACLPHLSQKQENEKCVLGKGIIISLIPESDLGRLVIEEGFGFRPTVHTGFRLIPNQDGEYDGDGEQIMMEVVTTILSSEDGDLVWLNNGENVLLVRSKGKLSLNKDWWDNYPLKSFLAKINFPYVLKPLPSPLL